MLPTGRYTYCTINCCSHATVSVLKLRDVSPLVPSHATCKIFFLPHSYLFIENHLCGHHSPANDSGQHANIQNQTAKKTLGTTNNPPNQYPGTRRIIPNFSFKSSNKTNQATNQQGSQFLSTGNPQRMTTIGTGILVTE